jgi:hypothetical protein
MFIQKLANLSFAFSKCSYASTTNGEIKAACLLFNIAL